jgi:HK97 gp10 family phage protein
MVNVSVDVFDPNVKETLAVLPEKMLEQAYEVMMAQAHLIVGLAQIYCPVDTGSLRDSIRVERGGEGLHWRGVKVRAGGYVTNPDTGRTVDYAVYQEEGTRYMMGRHFLSQAVEEVQPTIADMIKAGVVEKMEASL